MVARETKLQNAYESTLISALSASSSDTTVSVAASPASIGDFSSGSGFYLVIDPDSDSTREYIYVSAKTGVNLTATRNIDTFGGGLNAHSIGAKVRFVAMAEMFADIHDRVDTLINEAGTALNTTLFLDEDNMASDSATKGVTQQSVKAYVDNQLTLEDLDTAGNSGTGSVDLDSQSLTVSGDGTILTSTASGQGITFSIADASTSAKGAASFSSDNFSVTSGAVTIKDSGVSNDELAGSIANAKLANSSITVSDSESTPNTSPIALGGTLTFAGTANEVTVLESAGTVTISLPSSITVDVTGDVTGNVSGSSGSTTGNAATATALQTARTIGGVSFDGTANISLPGVDTAGTQNTSGTAAGLSATLVVGSGGTGQTSYTDGQLLIGNSTGNTLDKATLTQGSNVTITNGGGSITIAATDTNTEYTAGDGLDLTGTVFSTDLKTNGGLSIDTTELKLDLNDLSAASVSVANDSIAIIDADDNSSKKESIADLATAMADGSTITASNGVLTAAGGGGVSLGLVLALG